MSGFEYEAEYQSRGFDGRLTYETLRIIAKDADDAFKQLMEKTKVGRVVYPPRKTGKHYENFL